MQKGVMDHRAGILYGPNRFTPSVRFWPGGGRCDIEPPTPLWLLGTGRPMRNLRTTATSDGSASCGRDSRFTAFRGSGGHRNFKAPFGARNRPKKPESGFSRSWGPFWARRPPTKFVCMLSADPMNPVWGPMCPWGPSYRRFGSRKNG